MDLHRFRREDLSRKVGALRQIPQEKFLHFIVSMPALNYYKTMIQARA